MMNIYLDYSATTPLDRRVLQAMMPYFEMDFGNPSSVHVRGQKAEAAVENARESVAKVLHCQPEEIVFTSCGTESDNLALRGGALAARKERGAISILTSKGEHPAVSRTAEQLADVHGFNVRWLGLDEFGMVRPETLKDALDDDGSNRFGDVCEQRNRDDTADSRNRQPVQRTAGIIPHGRCPGRCLSRPGCRQALVLTCFPWGRTSFMDRKGLECCMPGKAHHCCLNRLEAGRRAECAQVRTMCRTLLDWRRLYG